MIMTMTIIMIIKIIIASKKSLAAAYHRAVAMITPMPMQSTNTTHSRNSMKSTKWSFSTTANPTDETEIITQHSSVKTCQQNCVIHMWRWSCAAAYVLLY